MQQYEEAFRENAIDAAMLPELTSGDLEDLGVSIGANCLQRSPRCVAMAVRYPIQQ